MGSRDRLLNVGLLGAAAIAWIAVAVVLLSRDPTIHPDAGPIGAALMGLAAAITASPLFWLAVFARHGRIAYRGDWLRAIRRGGWVGAIVILYVALRLQGIFQPPVLLFVVALVLVVEVTISVDR
jgi:hypothetical protein